MHVGNYTQPPIQPDPEMLLGVLAARCSDPNTISAAVVSPVDEGEYRVEIFSLGEREPFSPTLPFSDFEQCSEYAMLINVVLGVDPEWARQIVSMAKAGL